MPEAQEGKTNSISLEQADLGLQDHPNQFSLTF